MVPRESRLQPFWFKKECVFQKLGILKRNPSQKNYGFLWDHLHNQTYHPFPLRVLNTSLFIYDILEESLVLGGLRHPQWNLRFVALLGVMDFWLSTDLEDGLGGKRNLTLLTEKMEDHPSGCKWLVTMAIVSPLRIGLWDPFQIGLN